MLKLFTRQSKTIAGAALLIGASAVLSRVLGLVRDRLLVGRFGIGDHLDAYYAAFQIPNVIFALLVLGTLSVAFIPVFTEYLAKGKEKEAWRMTNAIMTVVMAGMGVICLLLIVGAPLIMRVIAPGFEGEKLQLAVRLTRIMMVSPFVFAVSAVFSSVLNALKQFLAVSIAPLLYNAALIFGILFLSGPFGIAGVAYGAIIGAFLHLLIQVPSAVALGFKPRLIWDTAHAGVRQVGSLFLPRVFGVDISQISLLIGSVIGTTLATGSVSLFNLSMNIGMTPVGVIAIPFAIAAFPNLSETAATGKHREFIRIFATTFRQIMFFLLPLSVMAVILRTHVIRVVIGTGNLSWEDTLIGSASFALIAGSLVFQGLTPLLARAFYALKNTLIPVIVAGIAMLANVVTVYATVSFLGDGSSASMAVSRYLSLPVGEDVRALALAAGFSFASVIQVILLIILLRQKFGPIGGSRLFSSFTKILFGSAAAGAVCYAGVRTTMGIFDTSRFMGVFMQAALATVAGFAAYGAVLWYTRSEEFEALRDSLLKPKKALKDPFPIDETGEL